MTELTEEQVIEKIKNPEALNDAREIDDMLFWVDSWKTHSEEELHEIDYRVSVKKLELIEQHKSVAKAEAFLEVEEVYREQQRLEMRIKQLAAFKTNLKRRFEVLLLGRLNNYGSSSNRRTP